MSGETQNFWDFESWGFFTILAVLLISLLVANILKKRIGFLRRSLIPTSVLGGILLLIPSMIYEHVSGTSLFDTQFFAGNGSADLEVLTYHALALGFIAITFKPSKKGLGKERAAEIFNTGITTVSSYLMQGVLGLGITILAAGLISGFFPAAGTLLPFGYGQGTGQALNYGSIYENDYGFVGGKSFGLSIAALGFISASVGGVIHLNILRRKRGMTISGEDGEDRVLLSEELQAADEIPLNGSMDKLTFQVAFVFAVYLLSYLAMLLLGTLLPGMKALVYGFNFLFGVIFTTLFKAVLGLIKKAGIVKKQYVSSFLMTRLSGFFFDLMIVAGVAAIRINVLKNYWAIILILGAAGAVSTYFYNRFVAAKLFPAYREEQFMVMYGMLTGTASTGIILLREIDPDFATPASENLVYQNFPAIVFGFPMMFIAAFAPKQPLYALLILAGAFVVMNLILFRSAFRRRKKEKAEE
jgi:ESS family glutamate:Na+ symporter